MSPGSVFLDLLPKVEILCQLFVLRMVFFQYNGVILELLVRQEELNKLKISLLLFLNPIFPQFLLFWQVTQNYFPTVLSKIVNILPDRRSFIWNAFSKVMFKLWNTDYWAV